MAWEDAYRIVIHQLYGNTQVINAFTVERTAPTFAAANVRNAFKTSILPLWQDCVLQDLDFITMDTISLSDPTDFDVGHLLSVSGNGTGLPGPGFVAATLIWTRTRTDVRNGSMRIGGIAEESYNGDLFTAGYILDLAALAEAFVTPWVAADPLVPICALSVTKRVVVPATSTHGKYYRLPETEGEYVAYLPTSYQVKTGVSSQVSRKLRRISG